MMMAKQELYNSLLNPGFEDGVLTPWFFSAGNGSAGSLNISSDAYSGSFAGELVCSTFAETGYLFAGQQVIDRVVLDGPLYLAKCKYKSDVGLMLRVHVKWGVDQVVTYSSGVLSPSADWGEVIVPIPVPFPPDAYEILFYLWPVGIGTILFDDCSLESPTPVSPFEVLIRAVLSAVAGAGLILLSM